jgi:L-2-hydroxyglutarate oxidase LhgO
MITGAESQALEPRIRSAGAILSPTSGIVSAHELMDFFLHEARSAGAVLQARSELLQIERRTSDYRLTVRAGAATESFTSERVVNAAGLEADRVAAMAGIDVDAAGYRVHWCKGSYFSVVAAGRGLVSRLVYPLPDHVSLGVHALLDAAGRVRFGPDIEYLPERVRDYRVDEAKRAAFAQAARRLAPGLRDEDLAPDISGIRPKLQGPGQGFRDFVIAEESERGLPGFVNVVGTDSPGLTASPAIAEQVAKLLPA